MKLKENLPFSLRNSLPLHISHNTSGNHGVLYLAYTVMWIIFSERGCGLQRECDFLKQPRTPVITKRAGGVCHGSRTCTDLICCFDTFIFAALAGVGELNLPPPLNRILISVLNANENYFLWNTFLLMSICQFYFFFLISLKSGDWDWES